MKYTPWKFFRSTGGVWCLLIVSGIFTYIGIVMGASNMVNTLMRTAHGLLIDTCFYLMAICVLMGALSQIFVEFGVVTLIEKMLRPLMKPLFNLPGVAALGAVMTFLSDNPSIMTLSRDRRYASHFKKYQLISLTNFGTAFGMGLIVIVFMLSHGFYWEPLVGFAGAVVGAIVSTRMMQRFVLKKYPQFKYEDACTPEPVEADEKPAPKEALFTRILNSMLDGGKSGVDIGLTIIPGVVIISSLVMILTFGPSESGAYTGAAYEGTALIPWLAGKLDFLFRFLFGFHDPHLIAFPITALGTVGAALGYVPNFISQGWIDGNAVAVFTAMGMCWSGFLSTHTAMLDSLGYRDLAAKDFISQTTGGICAGIAAHMIMLLVGLF